jgi:hypothetical protein
MITFLLLCLLFIFCWPLAVLAVALYTLLWLFILPFRVLGFALSGILHAVFG